VRIDILTLFPGMFQGPFSEGIFKRAVDRELIMVVIHNIRDFTHDRHHVVDDYAYGGGAGMVLKPEPVFEAVEHVKKEIGAETAGRELPVILLTPQGRPFSHKVAQELSACENLIFICGRYEGVDERIREHLATDEISIGDYVLGGGELAAMVVVDAVARLLPGVLGSEASAVDESHSAGLLEYPQYTRPEDFRGWRVPEILLSGNHPEVDRWRREQALLRTLKRRPDLIDKADLTEAERRLIDKFRRSQTGD